MAPGASRPVTKGTFRRTLFRLVINEGELLSVGSHVDERKTEDESGQQSHKERQSKSHDIDEDGQRVSD